MTKFTSIVDFYGSVTVDPTTNWFIDDTGWVPLCIL